MNTHIHHIDVEENVNNKAIHYNIFVMFDNGNREVFTLPEIESISYLKHIIETRYTTHIKANDIYFYAYGLSYPYQIHE